MAEETVELFEDSEGIQLDYSQESLEAVEELLEDAVEYYPELSPDAARRTMQLFGCYILEVARREFGGGYLWFEERDQPVLVVGEPESHVALMTWDKVHGRLSGDAADSIPFFYAGFAERVRSAPPGTRVLYV
jgi:hypothetical protein